MSAARAFGGSRPQSAGHLGWQRRLDWWEVAVRVAAPCEEVSRDWLGSARPVGIAGQSHAAGGESAARGKR